MESGHIIQWEEEKGVVVKEGFVEETVSPDGWTGVREMGAEIEWYSGLVLAPDIYADLLIPSVTVMRQ